MLRRTVLLGLLCACSVPACFSQNPPPRVPPDYRGVSVRVAGIFVTPVPGAPFSATVDIVSKEILPDGTENIRITVNHVARDSAGRIYNERRAMVPTSYKGDPQLLSSHIYDPVTHLNTFLDPFTHLARQSVFHESQQPPANAPSLGSHTGGQLTAQTDLGDETLGTTRLHGTRKVWTVPASSSGTGKEVSIVDEYWYSPELFIYLILKHDDPRTGQQIVAVKDIDQKEPEASRFQVPTRFRVVDETPAP
jgi:hypothetical protein